jgi:hypothetical protein
MDTEALEFYKKHHGMFLADFFAKNSQITIKILPRQDVESRRWYAAQWWDKSGKEHVVGAQWHSLLWERIIKEFLRENEPNTV